MIPESFVLEDTVSYLYAKLEALIMLLYNSIRRARPTVTHPTYA